MRLWMFLYGVIVISYHGCRGAQNYFEQCLLESGVAQNKSTVNMNDPQLKCFETCLYKKRGMLTKDKKVNETAQFDSLKRNYGGSLSVLKEKVDACVAKANEKTDECEVVNTMTKCISEKIKTK